ncbi:hypothetical protein LR48_Vigan06g082200 [Vigna angularis]|uniref:Uncharacterized protein n=1 Tax=Phaseolus angularis TaxID=3914 RepID=A0A0L9US35_PHAAN|nr:hypothetical protein LR48_Vigan06g082200 [Vigna angularis]
MHPPSQTLIFHFLPLLTRNPTFSLRKLTLLLLRSSFRHRRSISGVPSFYLNRTALDSETDGSALLEEALEEEALEDENLVDVEVKAEQ